MILKIDSIKNAGDLEKERLVLRVVQDGDVGDYMVLCARTSKSGRPLSGPQKFAYWFPDEGVNQGDLVVLYSKLGKDQKKDTESGHVSHFYYWKSGAPVWLKDMSAVIINTGAFKVLNMNPPHVGEDVEPDVT